MSVSQLLATIRDMAFGSEAARISVVLIIFGLVIAAVWAVVWFVSRKTPEGRLKALLDDRASSSRRVAGPSWALRLSVPVVLLAALLGGDVYLARPETCGQCHRQGTYEESLAQSAHSELGCVRCHMEPGVTGLVGFNVDYTRWLVTYGTTKRAPEPTAGSVGSTACLQCHGEVRNGVLEARGIRVRHSDFLATGTACRDCHNDASHPGALIEPSQPTMDLCLPCHDGETVSAECETCHVADATVRPESSRGYKQLKTSGDPDSCYTCHEESPCLQCHGIRMPHPPKWSPANPNEPGDDTGHARPGFEDRETCWRCHFAEDQPFVPADEGCSCHGLLGDFHNGAAWVAEHGLEATGQRSGEFAECFACHSQNLCDVCHPPSYRERYAPNPAAPLTPGYTPSEGATFE